MSSSTCKEFWSSQNKWFIYLLAYFSKNKNQNKKKIFCFIAIITCLIPNFSKVFVAKFELFTLYFLLYVYLPRQWLLFFTYNTNPPLPCQMATLKNSSTLKYHLIIHGRFYLFYHIMCVFCKSSTEQHTLTEWKEYGDPGISGKLMTTLLDSDLDSCVLMYPV